ncbi:hypothetical protein BDB00DRAFT_943865 [Zychaea mexicana]|uniref:uncharacterized protein n=1 Tax=Zychaea mexicana TaxID=64656 RepID=UPI0022FF2210|nr:uncharacterized protein BDB00DRAFT_943865 [Zychaea mexicana]KAI9467736.1 hypothetical protein BDB00DRAFT_943865 [Zychaea mexicana]
MLLLPYLKITATSTPLSKKETSFAIFISALLLIYKHHTTIVAFVRASLCFYDTQMIQCIIMHVYRCCWCS